MIPGMFCSDFYIQSFGNLRICDHIPKNDGYEYDDYIACSKETFISKLVPSVFKSWISIKRAFIWVGNKHFVFEGFDLLFPVISGSVFVVSISSVSDFVIS